MALAVWEQQADTSVQYSIAVALSQVGSQLDYLRPNDPLYATAAPWKLTVTPAAMRTVANALLNVPVSSWNASVCGRRLVASLRTAATCKTDLYVPAIMLLGSDIEH